MASGRLGICRHAGLLPLGSLGSEWYLRAFRGGCDYGGSGQALRAALWYFSVRLRHHHAMVARRLLRLQFCVWTSAALAIPGIPIPGLSVCALPSCLHPSPTPPRPPFPGGSGRGGAGRWRLECARMPILGFGWRWSMGLHAWLQFGGGCRDILSCFTCRRLLWGHGQVSLASLWAQEVCRRCIRRLAWLQSGLSTPGM